METLGLVDFYKDDLCASVGRMTLLWSGVEDALADVFAALLGADFPYGQVVMKHISSFDTQMKIVKSVCKQRFPSEQDAIRIAYASICGQLDTLKNQRNQIVHGAIQVVPVKGPDGFYDHDAFRSRVGPTPVKLANGTMYHYEKEQVSKLCEDMSEVRVLLVVLRGDISDRLASAAI